MATLGELKASLSDQQVLAAHLLTENEFAGKEKRTQEELADVLGITRMQLYKWRTENADFIKYQAALSTSMLESYRAEADAQLLKLVRGTSNNGIPSVKGLQLYYEIMGVKQNKLTIESEKSSSRRISDEEVSAGLAELNDMFKKN
jgi:transcriptional regulator with XRE-family HTH domain